MSKLVVIGLGYVGLPLAVQAAEKGYDVVGIDLNEHLIGVVNTRKSPYVNDFRFEHAISRVPKEKLFATKSYEQIQDADVIVICVPTPTENNVPDISFVTHAASQVAQYLKEGQLVVLESTVNPGVTRDDVLPILEKISGLQAGKDFNLAHCPERIDPGNDKFYVGNLNRVVGGVTSACTQRTVTFYKSIIDAEIIPLGSTEEAEFVKSWENSHRNVLIALANSAAVICDGLDMNIDNILKGLQSKIDQFGLKLAKPGIGPGGHCIPEDIHYVIRKARQNGIDTRFLDSAADLNDRMPRYAVHRLQEMIIRSGGRMSESKIALLGMAYKENIDDSRRSPSVEVAYQLVRYSKQVNIHDPFVPKSALESIKGAVVFSSLNEALKNADGVFLGTAHDVYKQTITADVLRKYGIKYVLDGRNCLDKSSIIKSGIAYHGIGR
jgi:UDP-N-acetyl-D-glucosamine dehydrogenase